MRVREQPRYWQTASSAESGLRSDLAPGLGAHGSLGCSPVAGHPTTESSPLAHSTTGTPVQANWNGDDWMSDFKEANHDAYFAPAYYEIPRQGSSRESVLMQGVNAVNAFGDAFSSGARGMVHELARHPVQSVINTVKSLGSTGRMLYDVDNQVLNLIGLPHAVSAAGQASRIEMGAWHALRSEVSQFETGTAVQKAAMLGSAALFVVESLGAGGAISGVGRLALNASRFGRVGLFGRGAEELSARDLILQESRMRSGYLQQEYSHWTSVQRQARLEELAFGNRMLREQGVPPEYISQVLQSFEPGQIALKFADNSTYGLRFYGGISRDASPYLNPTFPLGNVKDINALPPLSFPEKIMQWQIKPGSPYLFGRIRANFGRPGGGLQLYVPNFEENLWRPEP